VKVIVTTGEGHRYNRDLRRCRKEATTPLIKKVSLK